MRPPARRWCACLAVMLLIACRPEPDRPSLDALAERYVGLTRELARHDPSLIDHWLTDPPPEPEGGRRPVATVAMAVDALVADAEGAAFDATVAERERAEWLQGQVRALRLASRRLLGESLPFDSEARLAFGVTPARADLFKVDRAREGLDALLPGPEPLAARVAAFRAGFVVPQARRDAVFRAALEACREAAAGALPLPADEAIEVRFTDALPWDAHARYLGGHRTLIEVNGSQPLDMSRALRLACHEGYAGHHAQHILVADELVARRRWAERALVAGFGPAMLLMEGAADLAAELVLPAEVRERIYRERLGPLAWSTALPASAISTLVRVEDAERALEPLVGDVARDYLDNHISAADAARRLETDALLPGAEAFVFFIERRRTRILAYTEGRRLARSRLGSAGLTGLRALALQ